MELDADKNVKVAYTRGDGLISRTENEESQYYVADGHGDIRFLTDEEGKITDTYTYTSYGELTEKTGNTDNPYLYTGEYYDENTGFYYLRARYMNPETGSFISLDTYQGNAYDPASLHKYNYAQNNPQMYNDSSGHMAKLMQVSVRWACYNILKHTNAIAVAGVVSGAVSGIFTALIGGSWNEVLVNTGVGALIGMGVMAAYIGFFAIMAIFKAKVFWHCFFGTCCIISSIVNLVVALSYIVDGNARYALAHMLIAVLSLCGAAAEFNLAGVFTVIGSKGSFSIKLNTLKDTGNKTSYGKSIEISDQKMYQVGQHYNKHGKSMGYAGKKDYEAGARNFIDENRGTATIFEGIWNSSRGSQGGELQIIVRADGKQLIINKTTGQIIDFYEGTSLDGFIDIRQVQ